MTPEIVDDLRNNANEFTDVSTNVNGISIHAIGEKQAVADSRYELIPYSTQCSFYNQTEGLEGLSGAAHIGRAYYYEDAAKVLISVTTNAQKLYNYYLNTLPLGTTAEYSMIKNVRIELQWVEYEFADNLTYIVGMDYIDEELYSGSASKSAVLKTLFEEVLAIMGVDTPILNSLFGKAVDEYLIGDVLAQSNTDRAYVDVSIGGYNYKDFDAADPVLAVVFQIATESGDPSVDGVYKYQNSVTYQTLVKSYGDSTIPQLFLYYNATPNTSYTFNIIMP